VVKKKQGGKASRAAPAKAKAPARAPRPRAPAPRPRRPKAKTVARAKTKTVARAKTKTVARTKTKTVARAKTKTVARAKTKTVARATAKTVARAKTKTVARAKAKTVARAKTKTVARTKTKAVARATAKTVGGTQGVSKRAGLVAFRRSPSPSPVPATPAGVAARTGALVARGHVIALPSTTEPRRGPTIIGVPRPAPLALAVEAPAARATPTTSAPPSGATAKAPLAPTAPPLPTEGAPRAGVRLGRLPPREGPGQSLATGPRSSPDEFALIPVTPTLPRRPFLHQRWREVEDTAARLGLTLDTATRKIVRSVLEGSATLSTELRGAGHELAALVACVLLPQTALVLGPEVLPLADYKDLLERTGATTALLNDPAGHPPPAALLERIASGGVKVVLTTPKWLAQDAVLRAIGRAGISVAIVLEAHRASPWSHAFAPSHARVPGHLDRLGRPPVCAFAPGASSAVWHDVAESLLPHPPDVVDGPRIRRNVALGVLRGRGEVRQRSLIEVVRRLPRPMLLFCASPREVDAVHGALRSVGLPAHRYHEELRAGVRAGEQLQFSMPGDRAILVATSAFAVTSGSSEEDPEGVPLRYGRRTMKSDIRSFVRFQPPTSLDQLVDELSLVGRDGQRAEALVFHDPSDKPMLEAEVEAARPTGAQLLLLGRALESVGASEAATTTEALALGARSSRRNVELLLELLDGMGLVAHKSGWLRRVAPEHVLLRELRGLAERYATVRTLDARRLADVADLAEHSGCRTARLRRLLGEGDAGPCGVCAACTGVALGEPSQPPGQRHAPARRFTVRPAAASDAIAAATFHTDRQSSEGGVLTAKLADFR
jgi:ATP-dependent DNA helicase RecQ